MNDYDVEVERYSPLMWWFYELPGVRLGIIHLIRILPSDSAQRWVMNFTPFGMCLVAMFREQGDLANAHGLRYWLQTGEVLETAGSSLEDAGGSAEPIPQSTPRTPTGKRPQRPPKP